MKNSIIVFMILLGLAGSAKGNTIYVDDDANGLNDGSSWENAYKFLQDALTDATSSSKPVEILVAQGIYRPDESSAKPNGTGDRKATFQLINGLSIKGGYAGIRHLNPDERCIERYETILSGDLNGDDEIAAFDMITSADNCSEANDIITGRIYTGTITGATSDGSSSCQDVNAQDVWYAYKPEFNRTVTISVESTGDPFIISVHNDCPGTAANEIACDEEYLTVSLSSSNRYYIRIAPVIYFPTEKTANNTASVLSFDPGEFVITIFDNSYQVVNGSYTDETAQLDGFKISGGIADGHKPYDKGGGIYCRAGSPIVSNCNITRNTARDCGGGIYGCYVSNLSLSNCVLSHNSTPKKSGGAIYFYYSRPTIKNCQILHNYAGYKGGGIYSYRSYVTINGCKITGNKAHYGKGGAIGIEYGASTINACHISNNGVYSGNNKGALALTGCNSDITNCVFTANWSTSCIYCQYSSTYTIANCTIVNNHHWIWGSAIYGVDNADVRVLNCICRDNSRDGGFHEIKGVSSVNYCNISNGYEGVGNIDVDPCFFELGHWEDPCNTPTNPYDDFWIDGDYHLKSQGGRWDSNSESWLKDDVVSFCIDAGDMATPIGNEKFPNGGRINMGAYGGTSEASKSYFGKPVCETIVAGDINGDCIVNYFDFAFLAYNWLKNNNLSSQIPELYYYQEREKVYLDIYPERIAVCFKEEVIKDEIDAIVAQDPVLDEIEFEFYNYEDLFYIKTIAGASNEDIIRTVERLERLSEVNFCTPVFFGTYRKWILTDEFNVKFPIYVTTSEIYAFNTLHDVEIVTMDLSENVFLLKVKDPKNLNALKTSNLYYENHFTIYSSPNFIIN